MKLYIFPMLEKVTYPYHRSGALVVVAECPHKVLDLLAGYPEVVVTAEDFQKADVYDVQDNANPKVYVFPITLGANNE